MATMTLRDLYIQELKDGWSANKQMAEIVDDMIDVAENDDLVEMLSGTVTRISEHNRTLEELIESLDEDVDDEEVCRGMEGLVEEARKHAIESEAEGPVRDAAIISQFQRMCHYGIAHYGTARALAEALGYDDDVAELQADLRAVYSGDAYLTYLAETQVNLEAEQVDDDDEAVDEEELDEDEADDDEAERSRSHSR